MITPSSAIHSLLLSLIISLFISQNLFSQFYQEDNNSYFFLKVIDFDSTTVAKLVPSKADRLYYVQDTFADLLKPLAKLHGKTCGTKHHRLDNQFKEISNEALKLGLNSIRVDSSKVNGIICEYWVSLYRMTFDDIQINESIVGNNLLCVFGKFDNQYKLGNKFKINGRKIQLMPYEYVKRNIAHGKRGSVDLNGTRLELTGGTEGGEAFYSAPGLSTGESILASIGGSIITSPLGFGVVVNGANPNQFPRTFSYFLYNIYNEKIVIPKTRDALVAAKRKEWREKKAAEEAMKKANEEKKNKH